MGKKETKQNMAAKQQGERSTRTTHQRIICKSHCQRKKKNNHYGPVIILILTYEEEEKKNNTVLWMCFFLCLFHFKNVCYSTDKVYSLKQQFHAKTAETSTVFVDVVFGRVCLYVFVSQIAFIPIFLTQNDEHWIQLHITSNRNTTERKKKNGLIVRFFFAVKEREKYCDCSLWRQWLSIFVLLWHFYEN